MPLTLRFRSTLWLYAAPGGWHFITLPSARARQVKAGVSGARRGWGSVRVKATIGGTSWNTSIFPDKKSNSYLLPIRADVRRKEGIGHGDMVAVSLDVLP